MLIEVNFILRVERIKSGEEMLDRHSVQDKNVKGYMFLDFSTVI